MKSKCVWMCMLSVAMIATSVFAQEKGAAVDKPVVIIETSMGPIKVELAEDKTPITVKNFLSYVDDKFYDDTIFHRVMGKENAGSDFMIQGGGFIAKTKKEKETKAPIKNEAEKGLSNKRGTIAMARTQIVDSATAQFYINVGDNSGLDHKDPSPRGYGYCAFGTVIEGMEVVDKIKAVPTSNLGDPFSNVPTKDVVILSIRRVEKKK